MPRLLLLLLILFPGTSLQAQTHQKQMLPGPIPADIIEVIDGDSIKVGAHVWPGQQVFVSIRIRGIDAPEMRSRCALEHRAALAARQAAMHLVAEGRVELTNVSGGKYYGRMLADVTTVDGISLASHLLDAGLVRPYSGRKRRDWCHFGNE
ncbi:MAG: thermonuclease family protein [Nitratireductor sp.]